jgi:hypothetical protein
MPEPTLPGARFNPEALYLALDKQRRARGPGCSWRKVAQEAGIVNSAVGVRLGRGQDVHADTLVRLLAWLGETDLAPYITTEPTGGPQ